MFKGGMGNLMKQARQFQEQMSKLQDEMSAKKVEATSGGGMVKVVANCGGEILSIKIEPEVVDSDDVEMLEDLIRAACMKRLRMEKNLCAQKRKN